MVNHEIKPTMVAAETKKIVEMGINQRIYIAALCLRLTLDSKADGKINDLQVGRVGPVAATPLFTHRVSACDKVLCLG